MGLRVKFNLAILVAFLIGFAAAGFILQQRFVDAARGDVLRTARVMMTSANAVRHFSATYVAPLGAMVTTAKFLPATVPSFAAQTTFKDVQASFPDYTYREPTLNPTNPVDRATDWEADFVNSFRNRAGLDELIGERETPTGESLTLARPITIKDPECLTCHSTPDRAPASMISTYGSANGFGWKVNEVIGAQVVSVPMALPLAQAQQTFYVFMAILLGVFLLIVIILNVLLHFMVIKPVVKVARIANAVSLGEADVEEYEKKGSDEISVLSAAFNRMRRSLDSAMKMLEG
jgi:protein-histidine pros-kinase